MPISSHLKPASVALLALALVALLPLANGPRLVAAQTTATATPAPTRVPTDWAVVNTGWLNVRAGPSTVYKLLGKLEFNTQVVLLGRAMNTWVEIQVPGGLRGWVNRLYLLTFEDYGALPMTWTEDIANPPPDPYKFWATKKHIVQPGETLASIAALYDLRWTAIAAVNGLPNPHHIYVGQELVITSGAAGEWPASVQPASTTTTQATARYHVVQYGETLGSIAAYYGTTWTALAAANNIWNANWIYAGQTLLIP